MQLDVVGERCLVKFLDNTSSWSSVKELTKLTQESTVTCVLCKESNTKNDNDIITCDKCGRGYHQFCHQVCIINKKLKILDMNKNLMIASLFELYKSSLIYQKKIH